MKLFIRHEAFSLWLIRLFAVACLSVCGFETVFAQAGNALQLNGTNHASRSPVVSTVTDDFTMEAWVKWDGNQNGLNKILFYNGNTSTSGYGVFLSSAYELDVLFGGYAILNSGFFPTPGTWYHIALTQDYPNTRLYVNGQQVSTWDGWGYSPYTPSGLTVLGANQAGSEFFDGQIDEFRIWNVPRSASQIRNAALTPLVGNEPGLIGLWHFDEATADTADDATTNNYTLALANSPVFVASGAMKLFPPSNLTALGDTGRVHLKWNQAMGVNFQRYRIYRDVTPNPITQVDSTSGGITDTTKTITGLTNYTKYYFRITAVDNAGFESSFSNEAAATPSPFVEQTTGLPHIRGASTWGDYDNDGDLDILVSGEIANNNYVTKIFRNDGAGVFVDINAGLPGLYYSSVAWGDYNSDGFLDLILTGHNGSIGKCLIFKNNGNGTFTDIKASLPLITGGAVAWGDYDNDGRLDLAISGLENGDPSNGSYSGTLVTKIFRNMGGGIFNETEGGLIGSYRGGLAWGDFDNDRDMDLLVTGATGYGGRISTIYRNDGGGSFTDLDLGFPGLARGSCAAGDYDSDGLLDVALIGNYSGDGGADSAVIYHNNGGGTFTNIEAGMKPLLDATVNWGDFDNDGDLDLLAAGYDNQFNYRPMTMLYRNDGSNTFTGLSTSIIDMHGDHGRQLSITPGDYDKDNDLDILINGRDENNNNRTKLYKNLMATVNNKPNIPTGLSSMASADTVFLNWAKTTDDLTPQNGLSYNIRVGTSTGGSDLVSPMSKTTGGGSFRRIVQMGNTGLNNRWMLINIPDGTYFWAVQALDNDWRASDFSAENSFTFDGRPDKIYGITAMPGNSAATVVWNHDKKSDINRYVIFKSTDLIVWDRADSTTGGVLDTIKTISGLTNSQIYYFQVLGIDNGGRVGELSDVTSVIPSNTPGKWIVTNTNNSGPGSLSDMIDSTNQSTQKDTILFDPTLSGDTIYISIPPTAVTTDFTYINGDIDNNGTPDITLNGQNIASTGLQIVSDDNVVKGLVFLSFTGRGIEINGNKNKIIGNYFGNNGTDISPNGNGIDIYGSNNWIGDGTVAGRNIISGNTNHGIYMDAFKNQILGNYIGTDVSGDLPLPNSTGIYLYGNSAENMIGNGTTGGRNVISGNTGDGVFFNSDNLYDNQVLGNYIGVNKTGDDTLGNGNNGIYLNGCGECGSINNTQIGNGTDGGINVISGNGNYGIYLEGYSDVQYTVVNKNYVGLSENGQLAIPNFGGGIYSNVERTDFINNVVAGNINYGFYVVNSYDTRFLGNWVGLNASGNPVPNTGNGIEIGNYSYITEIGDGTVAGRNVISGNDSLGIKISYSPDVLVLGNYIGTNVTGDAAMPNGKSGIEVDNSNGAKIGDGTAAGRNVISGNIGAGIEIYAGLSSYSDTARVYGNYIGVAADGFTSLGNGEHGIELETLGGGDYTRKDSITYNIIAHNGGDGIYASGTGTYDNVWFDNSIYSNAGSGIMIINDAQYNVSLPVIDSVSATSILYGRASANALVHVYNDSENEGRVFIDTVWATGSGTWSKRMKVFGGLNATAIQDSAGNSSAFSNALALPIGDIAASPSALNFGNVLVGDSVTQVVKLFSNGGTAIIDSGYFATPNFTDASVSGSDTLFYGDTLFVTIRFRPTTFGTLRDSAFVINNSAVSPFKIPLSGTGLAGTLSSSLTSHNFGNVAIGDSASVNVKVYTTAGSVIVNSSAFASTMISANTGTLPRTLMPGDTMNVTVKFKPTAQTIIAGDTLKLNNNSSVSPYRMVFSGTAAENIPPVITIGVLSINIVNKYLGIYVHSNEGLLSKSIAFTFNSAPVANPPALSDVPGQPNLFFTQFKLTAAGTLAINVTATDSANNVTNQPKNYTVAALNKKEPLNVKVDEFILTSAKGVADEDGFLVAGVWQHDPEEAKSGELSKRSTDEESFNAQTMTGVGAGLELLATTAIKQPVSVSLKYDAKSLETLRAKYPDFDERKIGLYREDAGQWVYEGGEGSALSLTAKVQTAGKFAAFYNNEHVFLPKKLELSQNYPNPFNPTTTIKFGLPDEGRVKLSVYNILGQKVAELFDGFKQAGYHTAIWNGKNTIGQQVASGIYIYRIETPKGISARKMMLIK